MNENDKKQEPYPLWLALIIVITIGFWGLVILVVLNLLIFGPVAILTIPLSVVAFGWMFWNMFK